jgi:hypothetical protein
VQAYAMAGLLQIVVNIMQALQAITDIAMGSAKGQKSTAKHVIKG